jgi:hypothetical protein
MFTELWQKLRKGNEMEVRSNLSGHDNQRLEAIESKLKALAEKVADTAGQAVPALTPEQEALIAQMTSLGVGQDVIDAAKASMITANAAPVVKLLTPNQEATLRQLALHLPEDDVNAVRQKMLNEG